MEMAEEEGEPWVKASMGKIVEDLMVHYERSSIQKRIDCLVNRGIVKEKQSRIGQVKQYLLEVDRLNDLLSKRSVMSNFNDVTSPTINHERSDERSDDGTPLRANVLPKELEPKEPLTPFPLIPENQPIKETTYVFYGKKKLSRRATREQQRAERDRYDDQPTPKDFTFDHSMREYLETWNRHMPPERQADLDAPQAKTTKSPILLEHFQMNIEKVCEVAADRVNRDPVFFKFLTAHWPLRSNDQTGQYRYSEMLEKDWMIFEPRKTFQQKTADDTIAKTRKLIEERYK